MSDILVCCHGDNSGQYSAPALLPSKAATHPLDPDNHPVVWDTQDLGHQALKQRHVTVSYPSSNMLMAAFWK